jgi:hypothetical protein
MMGPARVKDRKEGMGSREWGRNWRFEVGSLKLEIGSWKLEIDN